jgi:hypothetical protein
MRAQAAGSGVLRGAGLRSLLVAMAFVAAAGAAGEARAEMANEALAPRAIGVGEALTAASHGSIAHILNPAGVGLSRAYVIEGTFGFRGADDARIGSASICDSTRRVGACLSYDYVTAAPVPDGDRTLHMVSLTTSAPISPRLLVGVTTRYIHYTETGALAMPTDDSRSSDFATDIGMLLRLSDNLNLAAVGYNVLGKDQDQFPLAVGGGLAMFVTPQLLLAADARYLIDLENGRYGGGVEYFLTGEQGQQGYPIRAGYVYDDALGASYVTAGLGYVTQKIGLDVGARRQVSEGDELTIQFGLRLFMPE